MHRIHSRPASRALLSTCSRAAARLLVAGVAWFILLPATVAGAQPATGTVRVEVRADGQPVAGATVIAGGAESALTGPDGLASIRLAPGLARLIVRTQGFREAAVDVDVPAGQELSVTIDLVRDADLEEEVIVVASTRTGRRLDDLPTRVEVLGREEIEEKMLMTPGDIVMMLNEMGGMRVQATSPAIGAASVRVQGMHGRYTRVLSDGLPLYGQQVGGLGLLQIPPMDLGQVEVIKGVASAFYGAGAIGGVVNLLSRRPSTEASGEILLNASTAGGGDTVIFASAPIAGGWSYSLLAGGHAQTRRDRDEDGWVDIPGYARGVLRPRLFWDDGRGRSAYLTAGFTYEDREGGTMPGRTLPAIESHREGLDTGRSDVGGTFGLVLGARAVLSGRGAAAWARHEHTFGAVRERDGHDTGFGEVALSGTAGVHTWVAGAAYEYESYDPRDVPRFGYGFHAPGVFVQDDMDIARWLSVSAGIRADRHSEYGTFWSPRLAALLRAEGWTSRVSYGRGFAAATPLTEDTEAAGLSRLTVQAPLRAERASSTSFDLTRSVGPAVLTATVFRSRITNPLVVEREHAYVLFNREEATTNTGVEATGIIRRAPLAATASYTYVRASERADGIERQAPLTPRHSAGVVGMWEAEDVGRAGVEVYYTGRQRLDVNPYRSTSPSYVIVGFLAERRLGRMRLFINAENVTNVRQTEWDPLVRPAQGVDGRWTVDAWAPLDGRAFNGGIRLDF